jgi:hypothetical protein
VPLTGEEIRARLSAFASRWSVYAGSERSEAQTFLNELFECYGTHRQDVAQFEEPQAGRFLDLIWPRVCVIEMKAPAEAKRLSKHRDQAFTYWREAADANKSLPAPRYVVICAFRKLEIWEPGSYPTAPRAVLDLIDLPDQYDALLFLAGRDAVFAGGQATLTREAVVHLVDLYERLKDRRAADPDVLRDFVLQCVWCLFAEDLGQLPEHRFTQIVDDLISSPHRSSADDLGGLFDWLNNSDSERPAHGQYAETPYANGGLFERPTHVHLDISELEHLREAAAFNWRLVEPAIFGSLLEGGLGHDKQWTLGAHYTHEADIQKIVQPTIVEPWRERIENLTSHKAAVAAQNDLLNYVVLDPACGSGNFLYVAYRELRRLEKRLQEHEVELRRKAGLKEQGSLSLHFPLHNMKGIEIDGFAVALARVTLWMGHKLSVDELGLSEATLPLADLSGIQVADALRIDWPRADVIIGNPPFHGSQQLRAVLGDDYVEWLRSQFSIGVKDYCVYWFRKAQDHLAPDGRAGLVGTNSVSQNRARGASLDYVEASGGVITSAVSTQDWPGEAAVDVSIVNWIKSPTRMPAVFVLDGEEVRGITPSLRPVGSSIDGAARLSANAGLAFQGPMPVGKGFVLDRDEALRLIAADEVTYRDVVRPYLVGDDIANDPAQSPRRYIIDFGLRPLEEAMRYPAALRIVEQRVKQDRLGNADRFRREHWWLLGRPVIAMREALAPLRRYLGGTATGKRIFFTWCDPEWCPSNAMNVFALENDESFGLLSSAIHMAWAKSQSSTLEDRIRYTPTSAFESFPWPTGDLKEIASLAKQLFSRRREICLDQSIGLTKLYNQMEAGAWMDLRDLQRELDEMVAVAYGWPKSVAHDSDATNRHLLELNQAIAAGEAGKSNA